MIVDKRVVILGVRCRILYHYFEPTDRCDLSIMAYDGSFNINLEVYNNEVVFVRSKSKNGLRITKGFHTIREGKLEILKFLTNVDNTNSK